jgi:CheY-like chemotaxis protein
MRLQLVCPIPTSEHCGEMQFLVPRAKLLLVDDRPANLLALEAVLSGPEYELVTANSGQEALSALQKHSDIALILLDVQMPGMDGFEVSRHVKAVPALRDIPIIFITAFHTEDPFIKRGYEVGGVDYFSKPFDPEILRLKVGIYASFRQKATLLREKERQLRESEELLRTGRKLSAILEAIPVGVIITDAEGSVCQTNDAILHILKSVDQMRTDSYDEFLAWWRSDGHLLKGDDRPLMQALSCGRVSNNEVINIRCIDHTRKSVLMSASPLRALDRHIVGAVVVMQDVTAHKQIEADIQKKIVHLVSLGVELNEAAEGRI